jgi:hypothetical protein
MMRATIVFALAFRCARRGCDAGGRANRAVHQPYAGMESRALKALSEQQIADLRPAGAWASHSRRTQRLSGPVHVLELAEALALTADQRARTQQLFDAMKARPSRSVSAWSSTRPSSTVSSQARPSAGEPRGGHRCHRRHPGTLRAAHLRYHLALMDVLTPEQLHRYGALRGYGAGAGAHQGGHAGQHGHGTTHRP